MRLFLNKLKIINNDNNDNNSFIWHVRLREDRILNPYSLYSYFLIILLLTIEFFKLEMYLIFIVHMACGKIKKKKKKKKKKKDYILF